MLQGVRRPILALLACSAVAAAALPVSASSAPLGTKAPDLRADPVEGITGPAVYADTGGLGSNRLLVRFDGFVTNVGAGTIEISGDPQVPGGVRQLAWSSTQGPGVAPSVDVSRPNLQVLFEGADGHDHFHLKRAMEYSLWNLSRTAQVAPGQKVGFCLHDIDGSIPPPAPTPAPQVYVESVTHFCESGNRNAKNLRMGVSPGWRDVYDNSLAFQWIDVSKTVPGSYLVASAADPDDSIWEGDRGDETNIRAFAPREVTVPGYVAQPVTSTQTAAAQAITLATTAAGSPGPRQFEIVTPPAHGTLSQTTGSGFTTPTVTYTPTAGYTGSDSFTYVARDASSAFPTSGFEPTGTVSIRAAEASVTISGAPASLMAGTSVQLSGVSNQAGGVTWSTTAGTILPSGLLVAPAEPPAGGTLTVRATSVAVPSISAQAVIAITPVPVAQAAPLPTPLPTPPVTTMTRRSKKLLSGLRAGHAGRRVIVGTITTGPKAGRIDVIVSYKRRVLGRCRARVGARKTVSCKIVMKRNYRLSKVRVTVKLSMGRKSVAVRRAFVKA